jgi:hypothetical protein
MTSQKKLKKSIRARARKTGESYTAARRRVLEARRKRLAGSVAPAAPPAPPRPGSDKVGAVSDAAIVKKTGHGLDHWFAVLDKLGPAAKGHTGRALHLHEKHGVPGWHAQGITVAYERARGLRAVNQSSSGDFQVSATKAIAASVAEIVAAMSEPGRRRAWLAGVDRDLARALEGAFQGPEPRAFKVRDANNAHVRYRWDRSTVELRVTAKPKGGATVSVGNIKLADAGQVEDRRARWRGALDALKRYLE